MASEDKASFPDGFDILPPKLKKRKVSCDSDLKCAICQVDRPGKTLRKGKESSVEKAIRASEQRHDEEVRARFVPEYIGTQIVMLHIQVSKIFGIQLVVIF